MIHESVEEIGESVIGCLQNAVWNFKRWRQNEYFPIFCCNFASVNSSKIIIIHYEDKGSR